jgi:hypothetical protein
MSTGISIFLDDRSPRVAGTFPQRLRTFPSVSGTLPCVSGTFPGVSRTLPNVAGTFPNVSGMLPSVSRTLPNTSGTFPSVSGMFPNVSGAFPGVLGAFPGFAPALPIRFSSPGADHAQVEHLSRIDPPGLDEDADLLAHPFAVQQGHGAVAGGEVRALKLLEKTAGGEPEGLAG